MQSDGNTVNQQKVVFKIFIFKGYSETLKTFISHIKRTFLRFKKQLIQIRKRFILSSQQLSLIKASINFIYIFQFANECIEISHINFLSNSFSGHPISLSCLMSIKITSWKLFEIYLKYTLVQLRWYILRSSYQRCSIKKGVLRNFAKFTGKHLCQSLFFNKVAGLRDATLVKKTLWHRCFPVNFVKFLRTPLDNCFCILLYL